MPITSPEDEGLYLTVIEPLEGKNIFVDIFQLEGCFTVTEAFVVVVGAVVVGLVVVGAVVVGLVVVGAVVVGTVVLAAPGLVVEVVSPGFVVVSPGLVVVSPGLVVVSPGLVVVAGSFVVTSPLVVVGRVLEGVEVDAEALVVGSLILGSTLSTT